jgi:hypothetical protein
MKGMVKGKKADMDKYVSYAPKKVPGMKRMPKVPGIPKVKKGKMK